MDINVSLGCPACGGTIQVAEGERNAQCSYCKSLLFIEGDEGVSTVMFRNALAQDTAVQRIHDWFRKGLKARDLKMRGAISEIYPIYIPFWRMKARAAGWVCGYREETRYERDSRGNVHTRTERIPMERMVLRDYEWTRIACDAGDIGVKSLRNTQGDILLHEDGAIPTFEATTSRTDAQNAGRADIDGWATSSAGIPHITFKKIHVLPRMFGIIFYPIWIARYKYSERTYFATIDGVTGVVLSGRAPGDPLYRGLVVTGGAACGILGGLGLGWGLTQGSAEVGIGALIGSMVLFGLSYVFFRYGSEVVEGDIEAQYKKPFSAVKGGLQGGF